MSLSDMTAETHGKWRTSDDQTEGIDKCLSTSTLAHARSTAARRGRLSPSHQWPQAPRLAPIAVEPVEITWRDTRTMLVKAPPRSAPTSVAVHREPSVHRRVFRSARAWAPAHQLRKPTRVTRAAGTSGSSVDR